MNEPIYRVVVEYNPVNKQVQLQSNVPEDLTVFGMLELGKAALIQRQVANNANSGGPRLVVPGVPAS